MAAGNANNADNWEEQLQSVEESEPRMSDEIDSVRSGNAVIANEMELDESDTLSELSEMTYSSTDSGESPLSDLSTPPNFEGLASLDGSDMDEDVDIDIDGAELSASALESVNLLESYVQEMGGEQLEQAEKVGSGSEDEPEPVNPEPIYEVDQINAVLNVEPAGAIPELGDEASAAPPSVDLSSIYSDWRTMWHVFLLYEQSSNELVRLLQLLQSVVRLFEQSEQQMLTPPPSPTAAGDVWTPNSWTFYRQQVDDLLRIARHFAQLIQMQLRGGFFQ